MLISIDKMKRDALVHVGYYVILYAVLLVAIINFCMIESLNCYIRCASIIVLLGVFVKFILFIKKHVTYNLQENQLRSKGVRVKAVVDKSEFFVSGDRLMQVCGITAYYTYSGKTYVYKDEVWYFDHMISDVLMKLKGEDELPNYVDVLVNPENYNNYSILKYDYIIECLEKRC
ncbi:MAG: hypothetical protein IJP29_07295 [Lachnospiraceae bacterium]|nr:hypothetical protein [Lachnospiraceae bacterium]